MRASSRLRRSRRCPLWALRIWFDSWPGIGHVAVDPEGNGRPLAASRTDGRNTWAASPGDQPDVARPWPPVAQVSDDQSWGSPRAFWLAPGPVCLPARCPRSKEKLGAGPSVWARDPAGACRGRSQVSTEVELTAPLRRRDDADRSVAGVRLGAAWLGAGPPQLRAHRSSSTPGRCCATRRPLSPASRGRYVGRVLDLASLRKQVPRGRRPARIR